MEESSGAFHGLSARHFYRARSLVEIAAFNLIGRVCISHENPDFRKIYTIVMSLDLPSLVKSVISELFRPIFNEICRWVHKFTNSKSATCKMSPSQFVAKHGLHWMWCGVIDLDKMAKLFVQEESFGVAERFATACEYSFVADIYSLWESLPLDKRNDLDDTKQDEITLAKFWRAVLKGDVVSLVSDSPYPSERVYGLDGALRIRNVSSLKHFCKQMGGHDEPLTLVDIAGIAFSAIVPKAFDYQPYIVPFFLMQINEQRQTSLVHDIPNEFSSFLNCLLEWPWKDLFIPFFEGVLAANADSVSTGNLLIQKLFDLFQHVVCNIRAKRLIDPQLESIAIYMWQKFSDIQRISFFTATEFQPYACILLETQSLRCLNVVFKEVDIETLKTFAFSEECIGSVCGLVSRGKWNVVELVVKYSLPRDLRQLRLFEFKVAAAFFKDPDLMDITISSVGTMLERITADHFNSS